MAVQQVMAPLRTYAGAHEALSSTLADECSWSTLKTKKRLLNSEAPGTANFRHDSNHCPDVFYLCTMVEQGHEAHSNDHDIESHQLLRHHGAFVALIDEVMDGSMLRSRSSL